uniref:glutaminase n=1 Tax=Panagrellus redivivus TaxID=6233 RepID=A0A7E4W0G2_PANRE
MQTTLLSYVLTINALHLLHIRVQQCRSVFIALKMKSGAWESQSRAIQAKRSVPFSFSMFPQDGRKFSSEQAHKLSTVSLGSFNRAIDELDRYVEKREVAAEELIYNIFKIPLKDEANIGKLISLLKSYGLQENDPRLQPMMKLVYEIEEENERQGKDIRDPQKWKLDKANFMRCVTESLGLVSKTLQNELIIPSWPQFCGKIKEIFLKCRNVNGGKVADYIPQLSRVNPDKWGIAICTVDGQRIAFGDSKEPFCFQSVSKAFNYAIAASELGADYVHRYVGQEPSGRLFNEICLDNQNKPHNPMVNSGAIVVTSLINNKVNLADRFDYMMTAYRRIAGGEHIGFNNAVFLSERATADRNYALAYYMKENKCFPPETKSLTDALDFYFQLCALETNCEHLAVMAATLANGGVCPITEERCIKSRPCRDVLSLMNSCGMYDYSGQFSFHVGLPAKSGVSGNMIVVIPNLVGIAIWSPPLDEMGNSCRGVAFCKELVNQFNFHNYDSLAHNESEKFDPRKRVGDREKNQVVSLLFAAKAGDINSIRRMHMKGIDLEMADYDRRTALHLAASEGQLDVVEYLLNVVHVRPDPKDRWNHTPLHDAKSEKHFNVVNFLRKAMAIGEQDESDDSEQQFSDGVNSIDTSPSLSDDTAENSDSEQEPTLTSRNLGDFQFKNAIITN